jgi:hypothetical protein
VTLCGFKTDIKYYDENTGEYIPYVCPEPEENVLDSGLCIFHDENYLKDSRNKEANKQKLKRKLSEKLVKPEPLICIGYHLPDIEFKHFDNLVLFLGAVFVRPINFSGAKFREKCRFYKARFKEEVDLTGAEFQKLASIQSIFSKKPHTC